MLSGVYFFRRDQPAPISLAAGWTRAAAEKPAQQRHNYALTVLDTRLLIELARIQLTQIGADFHLAMATPAGPFGAMVVSSIDDRSVRLACPLSR